VTPSPDAPLGVVDSGIGGLTVARAILDQLPHERISYLGDTAHGPYGPLPLAEVRERTIACLDELAGEGAKLLVIACNSGSAACLRDARERYDVPVVEVIVPAVRRATAATRSGRVGVIGTTATIGSGAYADAFAANPDITLTSVATPRFVEFVERGTVSGRQLLGVVQASLAPVLDAQVDTLVLGCTHYPLLSAVISLAVGPEVTLVSSAEETAQDVVRTLLTRSLERDPEAPAPEHRWRATGDQATFDRLAERFLGPQLRTLA
jgi:glutamate racemase